jgi:hypothetical protein
VAQGVGPEFKPKYRRKKKSELMVHPNIAAKHQDFSLVD